MLPEAGASELAQRLAYFGLDIGRYTSALAAGFLSRFPEPSEWGTGNIESALISTFAIGETTFMRHPEHFAALEAVLPELCRARAGAPLRAFSAGCSSGEEAYSLAATLSHVVGSSFELMGWDVNPEAVVRAKQAEYRPWSLRGVDVGTTGSWLEPSPCGVKVKPWLQSRVSFAVGNLYLDPLPQDLDIIFCRNVLLYFRPDAAARVLERLSDSLKPGGVLFLGHYDPRPTISTRLFARSLSGITFYERVERGDKPSFVLHELPRALAKQHSVRPPSLVEDGHGKTDFAQSMQRVRQLASDHRPRDALTLLASMSERTPLSPEVHVLTALVAEEAGDVRLMLEASRRACFLVPEQPGPNYLLSMAFVRNGELRRAAMHRRIAAAALKGKPSASQIVDFSEGLTVGQLRRLIGAIAR